MNGADGRVRGNGSEQPFHFNDRIEGCFVLPVSGNAGERPPARRVSRSRIPLRRLRRCWRPYCLTQLPNALVGYIMIVPVMLEPADGAA